MHLYHPEDYLDSRVFPAPGDDEGFVDDIETDLDLLRRELDAAGTISFS